MKKITLCNVSLLLLLLSSTYVRSKLKEKEKNDPTACSNSTSAAGAERDGEWKVESGYVEQKNEIRRHQHTNDTQGIKRGRVNLAPSALWELRRKLSAARSENKEFAVSDSENKDTVEETASKIPTFPEASVRTKPLTITTYHEGQDYRKATVSSDDTNNAEKFIFHLDNEPHLSIGDDVGDRNDDIPYLMKHQNTHSKYVVNIDDDEKVANFLKKTKEDEDAREKNKYPSSTLAASSLEEKFHAEDEDDNELFAKHKAKVKKEEQEHENVEKLKSKPKVRQENEVVEKHRSKSLNQQFPDNVKGEETKSKKPYMGEDPKLSGVPDEVYTGFKPSLRKPFSDREEDLNGEREDKPRKKTPEKTINYPSPHFAWQKEVVATQEDPVYVQPADENDIKEEKTQVQIRDENKKNVSYTPVIVAEKVTNYSNDTMDVLQRQDMTNFTTLNNGSNLIPSDEYFVASESLESDMNTENTNLDMPVKDISPSFMNKVTEPDVKQSSESPMKDNVASITDAAQSLKEDVSSFMKENSESLVHENSKNSKVANQYQQDNDNDNLKISEQMDKLLIKEKIASQEKKSPIRKIALTEISKTGNLTNPGEFIHSAGEQLVLPGRFATNITLIEGDSFMPAALKLKKTGNNFVSNRSVNAVSNGYNDDFSIFGHSNPNTANKFRDTADNTYPESAAIVNGPPKVGKILLAGTKPLQAMEAAQRIESYTNPKPGLRNNKLSSSFMTPLDSYTSSARKLALLSKKVAYSPTENLIISKKLREIDSRARATLTSLNNASLSHGPQTKEQFYQKEKSPIMSDMTSIPAQIVLSPDHIAKLSDNKKAHEVNKNTDVSIQPDPFHKKMAAYDNYLKHVGSNVIDTDACLRSDDPLKCENKEILKSSAVISKLDKELSKISSSAINELNQELSRTPTPGASIAKIGKTPAPKEFNNIAAEKFFDSPPEDAINENSKSLDNMSKNLAKSQNAEDFNKDETDKSTTLADEFSNPNPMESFAEPSKEEMDKDFTLNPSFDPMKKHSPLSSPIHACLRSDNPIKCENKELSKELQEKEGIEHQKSPYESLLLFSSDAPHASSKITPDDNSNRDISLTSNIPLTPLQASFKDMENTSETTSESVQHQQRHADAGSQKIINLELQHSDNNKASLTTSMFKHSSGEELLALVHPVNVFDKGNRMAEKLARIKAARYILAQKNRYAMEIKRRKILADEARMFAVACKQGKDAAEMNKRGLIPKNMPSSCTKKYANGKEIIQTSKSHHSNSNNLNIIDNINQNHNDKILANKYKTTFKTALNRSLSEINPNSPTTNIYATLKDDQFRKKYKAFEEESTTPSISLSDNDDYKYGTLLHKLSNLKSIYSTTSPASIFNSKIRKMLSEHSSKRLEQYNSHAFGRKVNTFSSIEENTLAPYKPPHPKGPSIVFDQFTSVGSHGGALMFPSDQNYDWGPQTLVTRTHISKNRSKHSRPDPKHIRAIKGRQIQTRDKEKVQTGPNYGYGSGNGHGYGTNSWGWGGGGGWAGKPPPGGIPSPGEYGPPGSSSEPAQDQSVQPSAPAKPAAPSAPTIPSAPAAPATQPASPSSTTASTAPSSAAAAAPSPPPRKIHETNKTTNKTMEEKAVNIKLISNKEKQYKYVKKEPTNKTLTLKGNLRKKKVRPFVDTMYNSMRLRLIKTDKIWSLKNRTVRENKSDKTKSYKKNVRRKL